MKKKRIAILFHENDTPQILKSTLINELSQYWVEDGHEVIHLFGAKKFIPADIIIVHVDLSVVPDSYINFSNRYPIVVNGKIKDIRKSKISKNILNQDDDWNGPVIVKTDKNCAGTPERKRNGKLGIAQAKILRFLNRTLFRYSIILPLSPYGYKVYKNLKKVPRYCFLHPGLVVEKFTPEMDNGLYCVRNMTFLGDRMICVRLKSKNPIVNGQNSVEVEHSIKPHPEIIDLRHQLGFDYGKFDYVETEGKAILLDANKTIGFSPKLDDNSGMRATRRYRADGLYSFFNN